MSQFFYLAHLLTNRKMKSMLIGSYGDKICFTYPKDAKKSQMFFSTRVKPEDIAETLRRNDFIQKCGEYLREQYQHLDFAINGKKIDTGLAQCTINTAGVNRTPIPSTIKNNVLLQGAMDSFGHDENTPSGIGGSCDTILMAFQNDQMEI